MIRLLPQWDCRSCLPSLSARRGSARSLSWLARQAWRLWHVLATFNPLESLLGTVASSPVALLWALERRCVAFNVLKPNGLSLTPPRSVFVSSRLIACWLTFATVRRGV
ncbi:unnamed protein product [Polarella glacialis]|uniref:Uncharacterized protein n=1 Tax=Polarella glacialis TaxID=89957 RepID=A0A813IWM2_POLGL|nr:unnamed protein product [Polarella glacialis]